MRYIDKLERKKQLRKRVTEVRLKRLEDEEEGRQRGEKRKQQETRILNQKR